MYIMFWKFYTDGRRKAMDLDDLHLGSSIFLMGGSPSLRKEDREILYGGTRGVTKLAINNAAVVYKPDMWVCGDRPECYSHYILKDPSILKFVNYGKRDMTIDGKKWKYFPNTLFYSCREGFSLDDILIRGRDYAWHKNTWWVAVQLMWRLGFRTVYMLGCDFHISKEEQYAWETTLRDNEVNSNKRLYNEIAMNMNRMRDKFLEAGFNMVNCSKDSALKEAYGYTPLIDAYRAAAAGIPLSADTKDLPHSQRKA